MAYLGLYAFHWCLTYIVVWRISRFVLSPVNVRLSLLGVATCGIALGARLTLPEPWATLIGCALALGTGVYTLRILIQLVGIDKINSRLRRARLSFFRQKTD